MKRSALAALKVAREREWAARDAYHALVAHTFRAGDDVHVSYGRSTYRATVTTCYDGDPRCTSGADVWIKGRTGRRYRVDAYRIIAHQPHTESGE